MTASSCLSFLSSSASARQWLSRTAQWALLGMTGAGLWALPAAALPQGGQVKAGQVSIQQTTPNRLNIRQSSDRAVIDWKSFSVAAPETVHFRQPSATSATLNRVTGNFSSEIAGQITANGQVLLVNPNGILFTPTAMVNTGSFLASTLDIANQDFMNNRLQFFQSPGQSLNTVENQGLITVKDGGFAALVAPGVENQGVINARLGQAVLAAGTQATLDFYGDGLVSLAVDPTLAGQIIGSDGQPVSTLLSNSGTIQADGGWVSLTAQTGSQVVDNVINTDGVVLARTVENRAGKIILSGGEGNVTVSGNLDASGLQVGQQGGTVQVLGEQVTLASGAELNVSGDAGGGTALVGGDFQGRGTLPTAQFATVDAGAEIKADAVTSGNGGTAVVWSDNTTLFSGTISARGGQFGGNGGLIETSGQQNLGVFGGAVDALAPNGQVGTWLLDPRNITIATGGGGTLAQAADASTATNLTIDPTTLNAAGANVVLEASNRIRFDDEINFANAGVGLTANAGGRIRLNASITSDGGDITLNNGGIFTRSNGATVNTGTGNIQINQNEGGSIQAAVNAIGTTGTATINLGNGTFTGNGGSVVSIDKDVTINGQLGRDRTVIDGENERRGFDISAGTVNLDGLVIVNGNTDGSGGGIRVRNSGTTVDVTNSIIVENLAAVDGGGIHNNSGTVSISESVIADNTANDDGGGLSNAGDADGNGSITVTDSLIVVNQADDNGGGIFNRNNGTVTVSDNGVVAANNADGSGGGIFNRTDATVAVNNDSSIVDNSARNGGGIFNRAGGTVTVADSAIARNEATRDGGGIENRDNGMVTVTNSDIDSNEAQFGGGVNNSGGTVAIANSNITGNDAQYGGGINNENGTLTITNNSVINGNSAQFGGGINNSGGTVTVTNSQITNNDAQFGGGINNTAILDFPEEGGEGFPTFSEGTVTITDSTISGNTAEVGGGINNTIFNLDIFEEECCEPGPIPVGPVLEGPNNTVAIANSTISNNYAYYAGGGIANDGGTVTITNNSVITGNIAGGEESEYGYGGGIANYAGTLTISNSTITQNEALDDGGGIHDAYGTVEILDSTISENFAGNDGGGIATRGGTVTVANSTITQNEADDDGGGIYSESGEGEFCEEPCEGPTGSIVGSVTISDDSVISENIAGDAGGGIDSTDSTLTITDSTITQNESDDDGGGISSDDSTVEITNSTLSGNIAGDDGGAIDNDGGTFTVTNSEITGNTAAEDGGAFDSDDSVLTITNSRITDNEAGESGGGIHHDGETLTITSNSMISGNTADSDGGGVYASESTLEITDSSISGNTAENNGGGIYSDESDLTITNSTISGNTAEDSGGGIYADESTLEIMNSTISGNEATSGDGGGIYANASVIEIADSTISENEAVDGSGGGIFSTNNTPPPPSPPGPRPPFPPGGPFPPVNPFPPGFEPVTEAASEPNTVTITSSTISNNTAGDDGGGIYNTEGTLSITDSTLSDNIADSDGGGIYSEDSTVTIANSTLSSNTAGNTEGGNANGGGLYTRNGDVTITGSSIEGNSASFDGGGLYNTNGNITITGSSIDGNTAGEDGGGIDHSNGVLHVINSTISNNTAGDGGGGIRNNTRYSFSGGSEFTDENDIAYIVNSTISNNTAGNRGGGIRNWDGLLVVLNSTITENEAPDGQGSGIASYGDNVTRTRIGSSIVANNVNSDIDFTPSSVNSFTSLGSNLIGTGNAVGNFNQPGDQINITDPGLAVLGDYGGPLVGAPDSATPLLTHALLPGSIALDAGDNSLLPPDLTDIDNNPATTTLSTDQRGANRVANGTIDIGAYESAGFNLIAFAGNNQSTTVNTNFGTNLQAQLTEAAFGRPLPGVDITFTSPNMTGNPGASFTGVTTVTTIASGIATASTLTANTRAGDFVATAAANGVTTDANFNLTNNPDAPDSLTIVGGNNQQTIVNQAFGDSLDIEVRDQFGNLVPNANVTFMPSAGGNGASIQEMTRTLTTNELGIVTFSATANTISGDHQVRATLGALDPANFILSNLADAPFRIFATGGTPQMRTINTVFNALQVRVEDQFGNPVPDALITFTAPTAGPSGQVTNLPITTDSNGNASAQFTGNNFAGSFEVQATTDELVPAIFELTTTPIEEGTNESANVEDQTKKVEQNSTIRPLICVDNELIGESGAPSNACAAGFQAQ